jgi:exosortase/archaeosortase family protein
MITAACAGPATFGVFMALFGLMAMDVRPSWGVTAGLFVFGLLGTWVQNLVRVVYLLMVGYREGADAMWIAHDNTGYLWFISWYVVFAFVYLSAAARHRRTTRGAVSDSPASVNAAPAAMIQAA